MTATETRSTEYETVTTRITIKPKGKTIFDLGVSHVSIDDEGGGSFVVVTQESDGEPRKICIDPEEWEFMKSAIDRMVCELIAQELAENPLNRMRDKEER